MVFPRGGQEELTPLELREIQDKAKRDLFRESEQPKKKLKVEQIEFLVKKKVTVGMTLVGVIEKVNEFDLSICLPNQLIATCSITEIGTKITEMVEATSRGESDLPVLPYTPGEIVQCIVVNDKEKTIQVSIDPAKVNSTIQEPSKGMVLPGYVQSKEDHGYIINLGIKSVKAFIKTKEDLPLGFSLMFNVTSYDEQTKLAKVVLASKALNTISSNNVDYDKLIAGNLVHAKITSVTADGLFVSFLSVFEGEIPWIHYEKYDSKYKKGDKIKARILYIKNDKKGFVLTLKPALVNLESIPSAVVKQSTVCENLKIVNINDKFGLWVSGKDFLGFIHVSNVDDKRIEKISSIHDVGDLINARSIGYDYCDQIHIFNMKPSVLDEDYVTLEELKPGMKIKGTVTRIEGFGLIVSVSDHINAICPIIHLSDVKLKNPEKLFKIGMKSTFLVVSVDAEEQKLVLSHRKSLLQSKHDFVTSYEDVSPGDVTMGMITAVKNFGCIVTFFNNVKGLCPMGELSLDGNAPDMDNYSVGQVIKCQVLSVNPDEEKLRVSFRVGAVEGDSQTGFVGDCDIFKVTGEGAMVRFKDGLEAFVSTVNLHDHLGIAEKIHSRLTEMNIKKPIQAGLGMVTSVDSRKGVVSATLKPLVVHLAQSKLVQSSKDLEVGDIVPGVVKAITDTMCFIVIGKMTVVAHVQNISDAFVSKIDDFLVLGQTIIAKVITIESSKVYVTLKASQLMNESKTVELESIYLENVFKSRDLFAGSKKANFEIGKLATGIVDQVLPYGVSLKLDAKTVGLLSTAKTFKKGQEIECQVADVDKNSKIVDLVEKETMEIKLSKLDQEAEYKGVVVLAKEDYAIVRLKKLGVFGVCLNRSLNTATSGLPRHKVGDQIKGKVVKSGEFEKGVQRVLISVAGKEVGVKTIDTRRTLKNSTDPSVESLEDLTLGRVVTGKVQSVKETQINVRLADNLRGRIHACEVYDSLSEIKNINKPLAQFKPGQEVKCKVIGFHNIKTHSYLPISNQNPISQIGVELSVRKSVLKSQTLDEDILTRHSLESIEVGEKYAVFVHRVEKGCLWAQIGHELLGRIDAFLASRDPEVVGNLSEHFVVGQALDCKVLDKDAEKGKCDLTLLDDYDVKHLQPGEQVLAKVVKIEAAKGLRVFLGNGVYGKVHITELAKEFEENPLENYETDEFVQGYVLRNEDGKLDITLGSIEIPTFTEGQVVDGYITSISDKGCFVALRYNTYGRVKISEVSDSFIKDWKSAIKLGQLVKAKIKTLDQETGQMELSLKQSELDPNLKKLTFEDVKPKTVVSGVVQKIEPFGIFISLDGSTIRGLCHISEVSENPVTDVEKLYQVGDRVQAYVLRVDVEKKKVSLSLKASYFEDMEEDEDDEGNETVLVETSEVELSDHEENGMEVDEDAVEDVDEEDNGVVEDHDESEESDAESMVIQEPLSLQGFSWDSNLSIPNEQGPEFSSDSEEEEKETVTKSRRIIKREKEEEEKRIEAKELSMLDADAEPETAEDFERLLLGNPNQSMLWIKYMAFQLELAEVEKARQVAERALTTIHYREEQERLNVLIAYLNLENQFGNQASLQNVFEKACQMSDPKKVYMQMAQIYERSENYNEAEEFYKKMVKKFNESSKIWLNYAGYMLRRDRPQDARALLTRSLKSLPKHKHIKSLSRFGQMEYKIGDPERARTVFEGLLNSYPKKADLWSVYLDMEAKIGNLDICRRLFERILQMKWSTKKMKFFFKKYLDFEKKKGTPEGVDHVKEAAIRYVETLN